MTILDMPILDITIIIALVFMAYYLRSIYKDLLEIKARPQIKFNYHGGRVTFADRNSNQEVEIHLGYSPQRDFFHLFHAVEHETGKTFTTADVNTNGQVTIPAGYFGSRSERYPTNRTIDYVFFEIERQPLEED